MPGYGTINTYYALVILYDGNKMKTQWPILELDWLFQPAGAPPLCNRNRGDNDGVSRNDSHDYKQSRL